MERRLNPPATAFAMLALLATLCAGFLAPVSPAAARANQAASGTVVITFKACPLGGDPGHPPQGCTQTIEAPASAMLTTAPDKVQQVRDLTRNADGSYSVPYIASGDPSAGGMGLVNFFSPDFNYFTFDGVDTLTRWYGTVAPAPGETSQVTVYYWDGSNGLIMPATNDLVVNVSTCGEGIDPTVNASGCVPTSEDIPGMEIGTSPLREIVMDDYLTRNDGALTYTDLPPYTQAQVVVKQPLNGYEKSFVTGQAEEFAEGSAAAYLLRNERRVIDVYFYAPQPAAVPTATDAPEAGTGTLRLFLLSCPVGVIPHDDPAKCTYAIQDNGTATVTFPETGKTVPLTSFQRDQSGAYLITGIQSSVTLGGISPVKRDRLATDADEINGQKIVYNVDPGQTRDGKLYYYDEGEPRG